MIISNIYHNIYFQKKFVLKELNNLKTIKTLKKKRKKNLLKKSIERQHLPDRPILIIPRPLVTPRDLEKSQNPN